MNAGKKREGSGKSGLSGNKLFGAIEHVHNPFSMNSHRDHNASNYREDESRGNPGTISLRTMRLQVEMTKAEAILMAQNLVARIQKS